MTYKEADAAIEKQQDQVGTALLDVTLALGEGIERSLSVRCAYTRGPDRHPIGYADVWIDISDVAFS
jgi:hypothetical protein